MKEEGRATCSHSLKVEGGRRRKWKVENNFKQKTKQTKLFEGGGGRESTLLALGKAQDRADIVKR